MTAALALDEGRPQDAVVALAPIVDPSGLKVVGESWMTQTLLLEATARRFGPDRSPERLSSGLEGG